MAEQAPKRSIDEIIGSIRSIMDRGGNVLNDDVPVDLTDLPAGNGYAEPVAPRAIADAFEVEAPAPLDDADAERMVEIAQTVTRNLGEDPVVERMPAGRPGPSDAAVVDGEAIVASFGRRGVPDRPAEGARSGARQAAIDPERPMHDRFAAIGEVVEEAVTTRGVVRAANDAAPGPVSPAMPAEEPAAGLPVAIAPQPQSHASTDPVLDDATLRPIIREWLDDNLPPLVERLVREELQKAIHGGRRGR